VNFYEENEMWLALLYDGVKAGQVGPFLRLRVMMVRMEATASPSSLRRGAIRNVL
jgi:hypothetical protein